MKKPVMKQRYYQDCFPTSLANITDVPYEKIKKMTKKLSKGYSTSRKHGVFTDEVPKILDHLGIKNVIPEDGNYGSLGSACRGRKAIVCVRWKTGGGHALAWNGFRLIDPLDGKSYIAGDYFRQKNEYIKSTHIPVAIETSLLLRIASLLYTPIDEFHYAKYSLKEDIKCKLDKLSGWLSRKPQPSTTDTP